MDLIDRQEAIKAIDDVLMEDDRYKVWLKLGINNLKPVDAEPVRHGTWRHYERMLTCSECGTMFYDDIMEYFGDAVPRYCPECGADMRGEQK